MIESIPSNTDVQDKVFAFLANPATHPGIRRIDTHAASVFLEGTHALKIKRAVRFPYLDYSTLAKRKAACDEEMKINRPFAPQIYRRVVPITQSNDGSLDINGQGTPIEFAIEMTRFDEHQTFDHLAEAGPLDPNLLSQGVPPDDQVTANDRIFGPVDGTPLPPGAVPRGPRLPGPPGAPPSPPGVTLPAAPIPPQAPPNIVPPPAGALPPDPAPPPASGAAPSSFRPNASGQVPPEAAVHYDPQTGKYLTPDGRTYQRSELVTSGAAKTWQDLILDRTSSSG